MQLNCQSASGHGKKTIANKYIVYLSQEQVLGRGSFATTYRAILKNQPGCELACKIMNKKELSELVKDANYLMHRVRDEVSAWRKLNHSNIVKFEGCQETKNNLYFFLELCRGGSLEDQISKYRYGLQAKQAMEYSWQLVSACAYLEAEGVVHRDIKPANILIKDRKVKLGDFGLARAIRPEDCQEIKSFFTFAGTLQFMAPEILKQEKYTQKCDVWSVGVTIFKMFTGTLPFGIRAKDNSEQLILSKILSNEQKFEYEGFRLKPEIVEILKLILEPNKDVRPTMSEVHHMLKKVLPAQASCQQLTQQEGTSPKTQCNQ